MRRYAAVWMDAFLGRGPDTRLDRYLPGVPGYRALETASELVALAVKVLKTTFTPPFGWAREATVEASRIVRQVSGALVFAAIVYMLAFGSVLLGHILYALGVSDRLDPGVYVGVLREVGTWLTYMVLAGIAGSALAGDLGARKIREELDALDVLGVEKIRALVVPRVVAITVAGLMLSLLVVLVIAVAMLFVDTITVHTNLASEVDAIHLSMNPYDLAAAIVKNTLLGFMIGIVACQKGLSVKGGAEGVGRGVAETVVITFISIWLFNSLFNTAYLTLIPEALGLKG
jgi:phospholipid/cholesterol/gamma-HCH transport system permease protein